MSFGFAALGLFCAWWIHTRTSNKELARGVFFFFTMEFLQGLQYFVIAEDINSPLCDSMLNKILTIAGFLHICLQPYFCHVINASLTKSEKYLWQYKIVKRLCLIGGMLLFSRFLIADHPWFSNDTLEGGVTSHEWLRGQKICTFNGNVHLAWSVPMADVTYYVPGASIHSFLMFAPFFAMWEKKGMVIQGLFLWLTGPVAASFITPNLMEQASIWCFFSIAQISMMLFLIRETLIVHWGRNESLLKGKAPVAIQKVAKLANGSAPEVTKNSVEVDAPKNYAVAASKSNGKKSNGSVKANGNGVHKAD